MGVSLVTLNLTRGGEISDFFFCGKLFVFSPSCAMLTRVVLMVVFSSEWLLKMFDPLSGSALCAGLLLASKLFTKTACDGDDSLSSVIPLHGTKAVKEGVAWLEWSISLFPRHGNVFGMVKRLLLDKSVKGRIMGSRRQR